MELYHIHTKGIHDNKWKEKKEITIDSSFENRLCNRVNNFKTSVDYSEFEYLSFIFNRVLEQYGFESEQQINLENLLNVFFEISSIDPEALKSRKKLLIKSREIIRESSLFKREMALDNIRRDYFGNLPSRMHALFATDETGINYWQRLLVDNDLEIFKIEVLEEPFKTSEQLMPSESLTYKEMYDSGRKYWNPKTKDLTHEDCEYLVTGKIKILEKVDEIKKK